VFIVGEIKVSRDKCYFCPDLLQMIYHKGKELARFQQCDLHYFWKQGWGKPKIQPARPEIPPPALFETI
jgi:hypothetical protein